MLYVNPPAIIQAQEFAIIFRQRDFESGLERCKFMSSG